MRQYDVICAGLATVDLIAGILEPEALKRDTTYLETLSLGIGGDAVNQAVVLSRLGCRTGLMALCGSDYWGKYLIDSLEAVSYTHLVWNLLFTGAGKHDKPV